MLRQNCDEIHANLPKVDEKSQTAISQVKSSVFMMMYNYHNQSVGEKVPLEITVDNFSGSKKSVKARIEENVYYKSSGGRKEDSSDEVSDVVTG